MVKFPELWIIENFERRLQARIDEDGVHWDRPHNNFRELEDEEIVALLECARERDGSFGEYQEYAERTRYKSKNLLFRSMDSYGEEWDIMLKQMLDDHFDNNEEWEEDLSDRCPYGIHKDFAKEYPELVTLYEVSETCSSGGWYFYALAVNKGVFIEVARTAFVNWAEKVLAEW